jgi:DNA-binding NtrC family response regulator
MLPRSSHHRGVRTPASKPPRKEPDRTRRSIVIVDDEKSYVELMAQMIREHLDSPVHSFTRPVDAVEKLGSLSPGVVVTDYFMPDMDGVEFIKRASRVAPDAAFIMISGHDLDPIEHELERLKMLKLRLQKPFGWRPLAAAVLQVWPGTDAPRFRSP